MAHDDKNVAGLADAFAKITATNCTMQVEKIGIGKVGPFGTVNRNQDVALFEVLLVWRSNLNNMSQQQHQQHHTIPLPHHPNKKIDQFLQAHHIDFEGK